MHYQKAREAILQRLETGLSTELLYHSYQHTLDVVEATERIAVAEKVSGDALIWLLSAAVYHDCGFLRTYQGHEAESCHIAREMLPKYDYQEQDIDTVCRLIEATQVPTHPKDKLEEILCDADSDYLGSEDFFKIGRGLYKEFLDQGIVTDELSWNQLQLKYLENHRYYTEYSRRKRTKVKHKHMKVIRGLVAGC